MKSISITTRLSFALAASALTVVTLPFQLGLFTDWRVKEIAHRAQLCENLATSLSLGPIERGSAAAQQHLVMFTRRIPNSISVGLRRASGPLVTHTGNHQANWSRMVKENSDGCFIVPIVKNKDLWGNLEVCFKPLYQYSWQEYVPAGLGLGLLVGSTIFFLSRYVLGRKLRHLDPSKTVPDRVKDTLDSFAEGVLLVDSKERIVLANQAFSNSVDIPAESLIGRMASELEWLREGNLEKDRLPWQEVAANKQGVRGAQLNFESNSQVQYFSVNSVPVFDDDGQYQGVMTAFADVTNLEQKKERLAAAMDELRCSRDDIVTKNKELEYLATRDPLTSCLNRRSLFERFEASWQHAIHHKDELACIMVDIDFFKSINDNYGHSVGDEVLRATGATLLKDTRKSDLAARYGGEEFCIVLPSTNLNEAVLIAESIRASLAELEFENFSITASLGVSSTELKPIDPQGLIDQADKCLYVAKRQGRNQTVRFDEIDSSIEVDESQISRVKPEEERKEVADSEIPYSCVTALLSTLAYRDPETAAHSIRVADLSVSLGRRFMDPRDAYRLEVAALLHDIGKIGVPDAILLKPGPLSDEEWKLMRMHNRFGVEMVKASSGSETLAEIVRHHHTPFSEGKSTDIPIGARIITIADAYDAMTNDHPYRKGKSVDEALNELRRCSGKQFDPELTEFFCEMIQEKEGRLSSKVSEMQHEVALQIGRQIERLVVAIDTEDLSSVAALSRRLSDTARQSSVSDIAALAEQLYESAEAEKELVDVVEQMHELLELSSSMHTSLLTQVNKSRAGISV